MLCVKYLFYFWLLAASEGNRRPGSPYLCWRLWVIPLSFLVPIFPTANGYETHCSRSAFPNTWQCPDMWRYSEKCSAGSPFSRPSAFAAPVGVPSRTFQASPGGPRRCVAVLGAVETWDSTADTVALAAICDTTVICKAFLHYGVAA